jgi:methionine-gamma-lyase
MADPVERLANANREYGEYGGVNPSIEISTTFTGEGSNSIPHAGELGFRRGFAVPATPSNTS